MRGSWPPLLLAAVAFFGAFLALRARSTVLAIERERPVAQALAERFGLPIAEVFAWRELLGVDASAAEHERMLAAFVRERERLGDPLAVVALAGDADAATAARAAAPDAAAAWQRFRTAPAALPGLRWLAMRDRFAARTAARE
jgi:hypothetical protein